MRRASTRYTMLNGNRRSRYQRAVASISWRAFSRYSSSRATAGCRVDATTRFGPWDGRGNAGVDSIETGANLGRPRGFSVGVYFRLKALNQFAGKRSSLLVRESERFGQELLGVHVKRLARQPAIT